MAEEKDFEQKNDTENEAKNPDELNEMDELNECQKKCAEYLEGWQRARADIVNQEKRYREEIIRLKDRAISDVMREILPLFDSFDAGKKQGVFDGPHEPILKQASMIMSKLEINEIGYEGEIFDPSIHQSVSIKDVDDAELDGKIIQVLQKGYKRHEMVIRPALVVVGNLKD